MKKMDFDIEQIAFQNGGERPDMNLCFSGDILPSLGVMSTKTLRNHTLPTLFMQMTLAVLINRFLFFLLTREPLRQPHIIPFILGGMVLGPSCIVGLFPSFGLFLFPASSLPLLETTGILGLIYYFFVLGVTMDLSVMKTAIGKKGIILALADIAVTIFIAIIISCVCSKTNNDQFTTPSAILGVAASMTGFPVLNRILVQLRLNNEMGMMATSCSIVETAFAWLLLPVVKLINMKEVVGKDEISMERHVDPIDIGPKMMILIYILLSNIGFIILCFYVVRPVIRFILRRIPDGESFSEVFVAFILGGVMLCALLTELSGFQVVFGPFILGLAISYCPLGIALIGKVEDSAYWLMLPLYFVVIGLRTHLHALIDPEISMKHPFFIIFLCASFTKVVVALIVSKCYKMPYLEGIIVGLLLNTKGFIQLIIFNLGFDIKDLMDDKSFALAICCTLLITGMIPLTIGAIYNPASNLNLVPYKRRSIQKSEGETDLRILPCIHDPRRSVPSFINLLGFCQPTKKSPISVYPLYLVEQSADHNHGPTTTVMDRCTSSSSTRSQKPQSDHIIKAFQNYQRASGGAVNVRCLTTVSLYSGMHEEICNVAEGKEITLIILPFHKQQSIGGTMEETNIFFRDINEDVLNNAPCSVAIFVDHGLGAAAGGLYHQMSNTKLVRLRIVVLFFGGPDDREALSLAWKMSENPNILLTVFRFLPTGNALKLSNTVLDDMGALKVIVTNERERKRDDNYLNDFKKKNTGNKRSSIVYKEKLLNDVIETVNFMRSLDKAYDLIIVGRSLGMVNPLTAGLIDSSECPELGAIGDLLASTDITMTPSTATSVLIVQQYVGVANEGSSGSGTPNSKQYCDLFDNYFENVNRMTPTRDFNNTTLYRRNRVKTCNNDWN